MSVSTMMVFLKIPVSLYTWLEFDSYWTWYSASYHAMYIKHVEILRGAIEIKSTTSLLSTWVGTWQSTTQYFCSCMWHTQWDCKTSHFLDYELLSNSFTLLGTLVNFNPLLVLVLNKISKLSINIFVPSYDSFTSLRDGCWARYSQPRHSATWHLR